MFNWFPGTLHGPCVALLFWKLLFCLVLLSRYHSWSWLWISKLHPKSSILVLFYRYWIISVLVPKDFHISPHCPPPSFTQLFSSLFLILPHLLTKLSSLASLTHLRFYRSTWRSKKGGQQWTEGLKAMFLSSFQLTTTATKQRLVLSLSLGV